jgi:hypothetical protein
MMRTDILRALGAAACTLALALPLSAAGHAKTEQKAWAPETLTGSIMMVKPAEHLLVITGPQGVPYDLTVTPSTVIQVNGRRETLSDLHADVNHSVTVRFRPEVKGDIAHNINVQG